MLKLRRINLWATEINVKLSHRSILYIITSIRIQKLFNLLDPSTLAKYLLFLLTSWHLLSKNL